MSSRDEVRALLSALPGQTRLIGLLLYGAGLRLMECLTLRVKDLDFARAEIRVRRGKGGKDRVTMLPGVAKAALERQVARVGALHARDPLEGAGRAASPTALERKAPSWARDARGNGSSRRRAALEDGYDIRTPQELLGHADVNTTMIYTHVLNRGGLGVRSPADRPRIG